MFADDCALAARSQADLQHTINLFSSACDNFGLNISSKKTEVMNQVAPRKPYEEPVITVNGQNLLAVDSFTYLGSTLSRVVYIDVEINSRIAKAMVLPLVDFIKRCGIGQVSEYIDTKLKVYQATVLPTLLHGSETWTIYQRHAKKLNRGRFH